MLQQAKAGKEVEIEVQEIVKFAVIVLTAVVCSTGLCAFQFS